MNNKEELLNELDNLKEQLIKNEQQIKINNEKNDELLNNSYVKQYIEVQHDLKKLHLSSVDLKRKIVLLNQELCSHNILYITSIHYNRLLYRPNYKCLDCMKEISGFIDNNQVCINEQFLYGNDQEVYGKDREYNKLHFKYHELKEQNLSDDEIIIELESILYKIHLGKGLAPKTKIRK